MKKLKRPSALRAKNGPRIVRKGPFSLANLLKHTDPGPPGEAEEFVRSIYEERQRDLDRRSL